MKKILYIILFSISILSAAQKGPNRFMEEESISAAPKEDTGQSPIARNPGDPNDPVPIDDYIPLLLLTGVGLIFLIHRKKKPSL